MGEPGGPDAAAGVGRLTVGERLDIEVDPAAPVGTIVRTELEGIAFAVVRHAEGWAMFEDRCPHARCAFTADGEVVDGTTLSCRCHGSEFDLRSGAVLLGPAARGLEVVTLRATADGAELTID